MLFYTLTQTHTHAHVVLFIPPFPRTMGRSSVPSGCAAVPHVPPFWKRTEHTPSHLRSFRVTVRDGFWLDGSRIETIFKKGL